MMAHFDEWLFAQPPAVFSDPDPNSDPNPPLNPNPDPKLNSISVRLANLFFFFLLKIELQNGIILHWGIQNLLDTQNSSPRVDFGLINMVRSNPNVPLSGVARAFSSGWIALLEGQTEKENEKHLRKKFIKNFRKEEGGTHANSGLWGWLRPWCHCTCSE